MTYFIRYNYPSEKQGIQKRRSAKYRGSTLFAPVNECVPDIPIPDSTYAQVLHNLAKEALAIAVSEGKFVATLRAPDFPVHRNRNISGYRAYMLYMWSTHWRGISLPKAEKLASIAWSYCPHKNVWECYAVNYGLFQRSTSFLAWLQMVPKSGAGSFVNFGLSS